MAKHHGPLLIDTNVILECHRVSAWKALSGGYILETVEKCVEETQNGMQNRHPETWINEVDLKDTFQTIHAVDDRRRAEAVIFDPKIASLDAGERDLWSHAFDRRGTWIICGPDYATYEIAVRNRMVERLICLDRLLGDVGWSGHTNVRKNFTGRWHVDAISKFYSF
ncbi:hypothetical protein [Rhizobium ruizarguesonis]|uniref:hypothetical protein n=1 Tax=Rhizobium ruizarguesonis TaxID=2081791 RepID=UPI0013B5D353|nr:hypothetical protein [Rhizobium ruizarguesonis]NEH37421.1 hypothetical protein [Rhizobium ruizarguesonis]NKL12272.1 hypothetical protein [Rhizobium leguminosarum bv. viciae]